MAWRMHGKFKGSIDIEISGYIYDRIYIIYYGNLLLVCLLVCTTTSGINILILRSY